MDAVNILIGFANEDREIKDRLKKLLKPLIKTGLANLWDEFDVLGGQVTVEEVNVQLLQADIILLLVSPDSLASDYFYSTYMKQAVARDKRGEAVVIPVYLKPCSIDLTEVAPLKALPSNNIPINQWPDTDAALFDILTHLRYVVEKHHLNKKYKDFVSKGISLFADQQWPSALKSFQQAAGIFQNGFKPNKEELNWQMENCELKIAELVEIARLIDQKKEYQRLVQEAEAFWTLSNWFEAFLTYNRAIAMWEAAFNSNVNTLKALANEAESKYGEAQFEDIKLKEETGRQSQAKEELARHLRNAQEKFQNKQYGKAIDFSRKALELQPENKEAQWFLQHGLRKQQESWRIPPFRQYANKLFAGIGITLLIVLVSMTGRNYYTAQAEKEAFSHALNVDDVRIWQAFVAGNPQSKNIETAKRAIERLNQAIQTEIDAFDKALRADDVRRWEEFISGNPQSKNLEAALRAIDRLNYREDIKKSLPTWSRHQKLITIDTTLNNAILKYPEDRDFYLQLKSLYQPFQQLTK